jgi:hypothetical protein
MTGRLTSKANPVDVRSVMIFRAKAEAEREKYEAQGLKAGEDFVDCKYRFRLGTTYTSPLPEQLCTRRLGVRRMINADRCARSNNSPTAWQ